MESQEGNNINIIGKGIFAVNKPKGPTSYDIVHKIKKITGESRVGHAGTLDPLASGVLVVGVGREFTKKLQDIVGQEKEYKVEVKLGETSSTEDEEGEKRPYESTKLYEITKEDIEGVLKKFIGEIMQVPPQFSAIKIMGKRAYKSARKGEVVEIEPRKVFIKEIEITGYEYPFLRLRVVCGKGTYIRSLARDIGEKLGVGGYVSNLERTRVGSFLIEDAFKI